MKKIYLLLLLYCLISNHVLGQKMICSKGIHPSDSATLHTFYLETNGKNWYKDENWLDFQNTNWYGVRWKVINNQCRADSITLADNRLEGKISGSFSLPTLRSLRLASNYLEGAIPDFNLPALQFLSLSTNNFKGKLPAFSKLQQLEILYARNLPSVGGDLPIFDLPLLRELHLENCAFTGKIPDWRLPSLEFLNVNCNRLECLDTALVLPKLTHLDVSHMKTMVAWEALAKQPMLKKIIITNNHFTFNQPAFTLPSIETVYAVGCWENTSEIPTSVFPNLKKLYIANGKTKGDLGFIENLPSLEYLDAQENLLESITLEGSPNSKLKKLYINDNKIKGDLNFVEKLPALEYLDAQENLLESITLEGSPNSKLKYLNASSNKISGDMATLQFLSTIETLYLRHNMINRCSKKMTLPFLKNLDLTYNKFIFNEIDSIVIDKSLTNFTYAPQLGFDIFSQTKLDGIPSFYTKVTKSNKKNKYKWVRKNASFSWIDTYLNRFGVDTTFVPEISGTYYCELRNEDYPKLVLKSIELSVIVNEDLHYEDALVFPNPTNGFFSVHLYNPIPQKATFTFFNSLGQIVLKKSYKFPNQKEDFDLSHLGVGIYLMEMKTEKTVRYEKIMIAKNKK